MRFKTLAAKGRADAKVALVVVILMLMAAMAVTQSHATDEVVTIQGAVHAQTQTVASTNDVQNLPANVIATTKPRASVVFITCETANIRWTVGGSDPSRATPLGHILYAKESARIASSDWIRTFRYTSAAVDTPATLMITTERN